MAQRLVSSCGSEARGDGEAEAPPDVEDSEPAQSLQAEAPPKSAQPKQPGLWVPSPQCSSTWPVQTFGMNSLFSPSPVCSSTWPVQTFGVLHPRDAPPVLHPRRGLFMLPRPKPKPTPPNFPPAHLELTPKSGATLPQPAREPRPSLGLPPPVWEPRPSLAPELQPSCPPPLAEAEQPSHATSGATFPPAHLEPRPRPKQPSFPPPFSMRRAPITAELIGGQVLHLGTPPGLVFRTPTSADVRI